MADPLLTPTAKGDWAQLLDRIDETISRALKDTAAREKSLRSAATPAQRNAQGPTTDRLAGLRAHLDSAAKLADTVESLLAADELEARTWTGLAERTAARLASPALAGIS
jgi:hypothetical protein